VLRRLKDNDNEIINVVCIENKQYVEIPRRFFQNVDQPLYRQYGEKGRMKLFKCNGEGEMVKVSKDPFKEDDEMDVGQKRRRG